MQENPYCSTSVTHGSMKKGNHLFDVTMGSYDKVQVCQLVGLSLFRKRAPLVASKNVRLHRVDGLAVMHQVIGLKTDRLRKDIIGLFPLPLTHLIESDFLDISFNLELYKFSPYRNANKIPPYIYSESNHPPYITTQLQSMISRRISNPSCYEN